MKLTTFIMFVICLQTSAKGFGQNISLSEKNVTLETLFQKIENQTDYLFWYKLKFLRQSDKISINVKNATIESVMNIALKGQPFIYAIMNKTVVVKFKNSYESGSSLLINIKGTVTDERGLPVPGATIRIKDNAGVSITDQQGTFEINGVDENNVLIISFIGTVTQEIRINNQSVINVILKDDPKELNTVVVVGYGSQKKKNLTGAVSVVTSKDLEDRPSTNFGYSLEGKAPGVEVTRPSGKPQAGFSIRVRGTTSITADSEPLYIVDGVQSSITYDINPADIETISILKDASSAAIYGASGANGVVLITTKRGKNQKPLLTLSTYGGQSSAIKKLNVLDREQYIELMTELNQIADWSKYTANTNWQNEVLRKAAHTQNYQLSIIGGSNATSYYLSGGWIKEEGVVRTNSVNRYNFKVNLDQKIGDRIKVGTSVLFSKWLDQNVNDNLGSGKSGVIMNMLTSSPVTGIYNTDGTFAANPLRLSFDNPVAYTDGSTNGYNNSRFFGNLYAEINILPSLKVRSLVGYDYSTGKYNYFLDPFKTDWGRVNSGVSNLNMDQNAYWLSENTLNYTQKLDKHAFEALGGFTISKTNNENSAIETKNFSGISVITVNGGAIINSAQGARSARANEAFLGRINYAYDDKYLFTGNFRADASSVFGPSNRWGYFPSFSMGWRISQEEFLKDVSILNDLKLRYGWGKVGNDHIAAYSWYGKVGVGYNYILGGVLSSGTGPETPENKDLRWETTTQNNIGIDVSILNARLNLSVDLYKKQTNDLLFDKPVGFSSGFSGALQNIGSLENKGLEIALNTKNLVKTFKWETNFNMSFNRNKIGNISDQVLPVGAIFQREEAAIIKEGYPLNTFWGYVAKGVDPSTGMEIYEDLNNDDILDNKDKQVIGNANPKFTYGLTNTFSFKNFNINVFIQGVYGNDIFNGTRVETEALNDFRNQSTAVLRRWKTVGQVTDIPKAISDNTSNSLISSRFIENGSYLRLKTLTLGYTIPSSYTRRFKIQKINLYATSENLLTSTKYSGYDPEVSAFGGENGIAGIDYGTYPQVRQFIFGLNVSF